MLPEKLNSFNTSAPSLAPLTCSVSTYTFPWLSQATLGTVTCV